jgi:hypothetical protein
MTNPMVFDPPHGGLVAWFGGERFFAPRCIAIHFLYLRNHCKEKTLKPRTTGIRVLPGTRDLLVLAPHAPVIDGRYENDIRTGIVAEEIHRRLGCFTIINDRYFKPKGPIAKSYEDFFLDLFRIDHARKVPVWRERIREVAGGEGHTLVIWVHGIADDKALQMGMEHVERDLFPGKAQALGAVVGHGQGGDPKTGENESRLTARPSTARRFCQCLTLEGMPSVPTHPAAWNYRGRDAKRLNQWFVQLGYGLDRVESLQLEMREKSYRDTDKNAAKAGAIIAAALQRLQEG